MKKIAVINDLSGLGKCSLTAAIPVISVMGVQAVPLPTAILSNQTGYESYYCDDCTRRISQITAEWKKRGFQPDGIYSGFLSGVEQAEEVLAFLKEFRKKDTSLLIDPVMADQGAVYDIYSDALCEKMRALAVQADIITPNLSEAILLLYGKEGLEKIWKRLAEQKGKKRLKQIEKIASALEEKFSVKALVITGIDYREEKKVPRIGNLVREDGKTIWIFTKKSGGSYSGTGDLFASVICAGIQKGWSVKKCARRAVEFLSEAIASSVQEGTDRNDGVNFETFLWKLGGKKS